jgi:hypothetical protein
VFSPYYKNVKDFDLHTLKKTVDKYFEIVTFVKKLQLTGGEPLLHKQLPDLIKYISDNYYDKFDNIVIITNGTIVPRDNLDIYKRTKKLSFIIDNYGNNISKKVNELEELLNSMGVHFSTRKYYGEDLYCNGWVDFGDLTEKKHMTQDDTEYVFNQCALPQKISFTFATLNGTMYPCISVKVGIDKGVTSPNKNESLDLFDETLSIEEKQSRIISIQKIKSLSICAYCNGLCDDSPRFQAGEQLVTSKVAVPKSDIFEPPLI